MDKINRCVAINKNDKRCRAKLDGTRLFCCKSHEPINNDIINQCCLCTEKIEKTCDILFFRCKHAFHKPCYEEWLKYSTYENPICIICRSENNTYECYKKKTVKPRYIQKTGTEDIQYIKNIMKILYS